MEVLWWLAPPALAAVVTMLWATWMGRSRDEVVRDDSDAALERMRRAIEKPTPQKKRRVVSTPLEQTHGVAVRRVGHDDQLPDSRAG